MRRGSNLLLVALSTFLMTEGARAQMYVQDAQGVDLSGPVSLMAVDGGVGGVGGVGPTSPLFLNSGASGLDLRAQGFAGGKTSTDLNNLQIGFDYLRPYWSSRDFTLVVPSGVAGNFPVLGDTSHVDDHFALAPRINYKYDVVNNDLSVNASGTFLSLNGSLQRNISSTDGGQGNLSAATSSLTIVAVNLPEFSTRVYYGDWVDRNSCFWCDGLQDVAIDVGIGSRYSSISQNYTSSLTNTGPGGHENEFEPSLFDAELRRESA